MMSSIEHQAGSPHVYWHSHFQACLLTPIPDHKQGPIFSASCLWQSPSVSHCPYLLLVSLSVPTRPRGAIPSDSLTLLSLKRISVIPMGEP